MPKIASGSALALDYVPVIDWTDQLRNARSAAGVTAARDRNMQSDDPHVRRAASGTIPGVGVKSAHDAGKVGRMAKSSGLG